MAITQVNSLCLLACEFPSWIFQDSLKNRKGAQTQLRTQSQGDAVNVTIILCYLQLFFSESSRAPEAPL